MDLDRPCPSCGADNRPIAKLCDQCGAPLHPAGTVAPPPAAWYADINRPRVLAQRLLQQAYVTTYRLQEHRLKGLSISPVQVRALSLVRLLPPPTTPSVLALNLALDSRTVSDLVTRLEVMGWLRRVRDLKDRRAVRLELTDEGEQVLSDAWTPAVAANEEAWSSIGEDDLRQVLIVLQRVRNSTLEKLGYQSKDIFGLGPNDGEQLKGAR